MPLGALSVPPVGRQTYDLGLKDWWADMDGVKHFRARYSVWIPRSGRARAALLLVAVIVGGAGVGLYLATHEAGVPTASLLPIPRSSRVLSDVGGPVSHGNLDTVTNAVRNRVIVLAGPVGVALSSYASAAAEILLGKGWSDPRAFENRADGGVKILKLDHLGSGAEVDVNAPDKHYYAALIVANPGEFLTSSLTPQAKASLRSAIKERRPLLEIVLRNGPHGLIQPTPPQT
jgi:hypothetical protein